MIPLHSYHTEFFTLSVIFFLKKNLENLPCAFEIVWLVVVIELISSNCNPTTTCEGSKISDISSMTDSVPSLVNSCKCVMSGHAQDITANCRIGQNEI